MARKLDDQMALASKTPPEVADALRWEAERIAEEQDVTVPWGNRKPRRAPPVYLLNWILCHFLTRSEKERDRIAREGRAVFDQRMKSDRPVRFALDAVAADPLESSDSEGAPAPPSAVELPKAGAILQRGRKRRKRDNDAIGHDAPVVPRDVPSRVG